MTVCCKVLKIELSLILGTVTVYVSITGDMTQTKQTPIKTERKDLMMSTEPKR